MKRRRNVRRQNGTTPSSSAPNRWRRVGGAETAVPKCPSPSLICSKELQIPIFSKILIWIKIFVMQNIWITIQHIKICLQKNIHSMYAVINPLWQQPFKLLRSKFCLDRIMKKFFWAIFHVQIPRNTHATCKHKHYFYVILEGVPYGMMHTEKRFLGGKTRTF